MNQFAVYQDHAVTSQAPGHLIVMLVEGAVKFLRQAIADLEANNAAGKGEALTRAMDILEELNLSLDMDAGGEIATNLRSLYDFMHRHLMQAHVRNDPQRIREVVRILEDLNEGWRAIAG